MNGKVNVGMSPIFGSAGIWNDGGKNGNNGDGGVTGVVRPTTGL